MKSNMSKMTDIDYKLVRSKRKTLSLVIDSDASLTVRAPLRMPKREIEAFIEKKAGWIAAKQREMKMRSDKFEKLVVENGAGFLYFGRPYTIMKCGTDAIKTEEDKLLVKYDTDIDDIVKWMKETAADIIKRRAEFYAQIMNVKYSVVKISGAKTRWGSCSAKNSLNFSWRLVMCSPQVIDYVVVHELAHIIHKNHGRDFWAMVETYMPNYKAYRKWLRDNSKIMEII